MGGREDKHTSKRSAKGHVTLESGRATNKGVRAPGGHARLTRGPRPGTCTREGEEVPHRDLTRTIRPVPNDTTSLGRVIRASKRLSSREHSRCGRRSCRRSTRRGNSRATASIDKKKVSACTISSVRRQLLFVDCSYWRCDSTNNAARFLNFVLSLQDYLFSLGGWRGRGSAPEAQKAEFSGVLNSQVEQSITLLA